MSLFESLKDALLQKQAWKDAGLCQECGGPVLFGTDSPDERLENRFCRSCAPAWLVAFYCRRMARLPGQRPMRSG